MIRNLNHQVSFECYAGCVRAQLAFAAGLDEDQAAAVVRDADADVRSCYDHGVSVDACAASL